MRLRKGHGMSPRRADPADLVGLVARCALDAVPCICVAYYVNVGREDPRCRHHDLARAVAYAWDCECEGCERLRV